MQTRPSTIYIRRCGIKRRTLRCWLAFLILWILLLCCGVGGLLSLLLAAATSIVFNLWLTRSI